MNIDSEPKKIIKKEKKTNKDAISGVRSFQKAHNWLSHQFISILPITFSIENKPAGFWGVTTSPVSQSGVLDPKL